MQRASRSAAVRPALGLQPPTVRTIAIALAIVLVTTRSTANGFTLRKIEASVDTPLEVESILQNAAKNLHPSYNETKVESVQTTNQPETLKAAETTTDIGITLLKVDVTSPIVTTKNTMNIPTITTVEKLTIIENNYSTLPTTITETLKQETNDYESTTNILNTSVINSLENQVTTVSTQNETSSEHETTITSSSMTTTTKLDSEVINISEDRNVSQSNLSVSKSDVTVSMDTSSVFPETSTMETLKVTTNKNETSTNAYTLNDSSSKTVLPFVINESGTDVNADLIRTTKFNDFLSDTQEPTTNKIANNEVLSMSDTKSFHKQVLSEPTSTTKNLETLAPSESPSNFRILDQKPTSVNISDDNTVSLDVFTDPPSDVIMSASTIVTSVSELSSSESSKATPSNNEQSTKFETLSTVQESQPTQVPEAKTVVMDLNTEVPESSMSTNDTVQVTVFDVGTNKTEVYVDENPTTRMEFVNREILQEDDMDTKTTIDKYTITMPPWKKYITLDRTRSTTTSPEKSTKPYSEMVGAETGPILGNVFTNSPIPSVIELEKDFIKSHDSTTIKFETTNTSDRGIADSTNVSQQVETLTTLDIVTSKRAGYIDNTAITTTSLPQSEPATTVYMNKEPFTEIGLFGQMYDTESNEPEFKTTTNLGSQSRLVEDAMKEELMIEKILREHENIQEDTRDGPLGDQATAGESAPNQEAPPTKSEVVTEDTLSVKPIKKKLTLYTVSSNYKPLKKLDVQPAKQFVRDPDDNSWRNESISSLGIVFKPKNASKSFTEVLKNKTTELNNITENNQSQVPDLRVRLGKIAEVRKSKKKKINMYGDTVYSDYEESSKEGSNSSGEKVTSPITPSETTSQPELPLNTACNPIENYIPKDRLKQLKEELIQSNKNEEIYDDSDDYDADYVTKIDLKKFTVPFYRNKNVYTTMPPMTVTTEKTEPYTYFPDRQPTVQYFPPTKKAKTLHANKVYPSEYRPLKNPFVFKEKTEYNMPFNSAPVDQIDQFEDPRGKTTNSMQSQPQAAFVSDDEHYIKPTYIIKQVRDKPQKDEPLHYTEAPVQGVTINDIDKFSPTKVASYDYDGQFRRDIVHRFVDNFNQNSDKFKVDFPILYNNSVVHRTVEGGKVLASSSTFVKRLYESTKTPSFLSDLKPCDVHCENMKTVDLSPAYELHYYVPDQEEKEEMKPQPAVFPYQFRL